MPTVSTALTNGSELVNDAPVGAKRVDPKGDQLHSNPRVAQATASQIFDNNTVEILTAEQLAQKLQVKTSWVIANCSRAKTRDPLPVLRIGKHRRFRWNTKEMNDWLDRRAGVSARRAGP
jgi:hypothetical protein